LALVAGFAEGRHEIDGEFVDTVVAAQGGTLEGPEGTEDSVSAELLPSTGTSSGASSTSDNGLHSTVEELSRRVSRLEGMVLELTSQLVPAMTNYLSKPPVDSAQPASADNLRHSDIPFEKLDFDKQPHSRKKWWSRWLKG
jgi:hypothetical protein